MLHTASLLGSKATLHLKGTGQVFLSSLTDCDAYWARGETSSLGQSTLDLLQKHTQQDHKGADVGKKAVDVLYQPPCSFAYR